MCEISALAAARLVRHLGSMTNNKKAPALWVPAMMALAAVLMVVAMVRGGFDPLMAVAAACFAVAAIGIVAKAKRDKHE
jgi:CHASE2 domain-containing sensor protein